MPGDTIQIAGRAADRNRYDAIVVGSGISGGWAAKELCERGLRVLLLERGRSVEHIKDYTNTDKDPWELERHGAASLQAKKESPVQSSIYAWTDVSRHFFVKDEEHPYVQQRPFGWIRGYQLGGRSLVWGRQCYRLSDLDFSANEKDGHGVDWPLRYAELAPWYGYVERFTGVSGAAEGLVQLPDGEFLPPMEMNCLEKEVAQRISQAYRDGRKLIIGRVANLTRQIGGRGPCQYRNKCQEGCPFGGYFSSNAATLPAAAATGRLTIRPFSIVKEVIYDKEKRRAAGVRIIDAETLAEIEYTARIIFLNASAIATTAILLQSVSGEFPFGMGNHYGMVGRYMMNHHVGAGASGVFDGMEDKYYYGRRANGVYLPRFRNLGKETARPDYLRGFAYQGSAGREGYGRDNAAYTIGVSLKEALTEPGKWTMSLGGFGEVLPYYDNRVYLDKDRKDKWGLPLVVIDCGIGENEKKMRRDMVDSAAEMLERTGFRDVHTYDRALDPAARVLSVHEMGGACMGRDPRHSVVNGNNQVHGVGNVFVTDGACMSSSGCQNPSLTYMALTARACDYAVGELKKGNL